MGFEKGALSNEEKMIDASAHLWRALVDEQEVV